MRMQATADPHTHMTASSQPPASQPYSPASGQSSVVLIILSSQGKVTRCISFFILDGCRCKFEMNGGMSG
jgi:hypothetical protein